ncbi:6-pyruvoyl trahydropterin synthase family protein [Staphylococcus devriesei]|uniref:6-carboxy-5,6,7,8-tetrahydropterin synthase n=1 Tax=Staphylococcus devriesei TaxID=586733 RepID=A0ABX5I228_9STAP|nr:6-carboxytetrahydropterin synthase [Staphylococcus devriesei]PTF13748.1 6-pyruvoyl tetrahydropterin synthase [Staphylococcus devriesei]
MTRDFSHIEVPKHFQYRSGDTILKQSYDFICDNRIYFSEEVYRDLSQHPYRLYVDILSPIGKYGLGLDFNDVDATYKQHIEPKLHHQLLNDTLPHMNTTAENIAMWIWDEFESQLPEGCQMYNLELFETERHGVSLNRSIMNN